MVEGSRIRREYAIAPGRIEGPLRRGKALTADYVLIYRNTKLAVVEAKAWDQPLTEGVGQAKDYATKLRNAPEYSANGIKKNLWHTVHIPDIVMLKMKMEDGFDCYTASAKEIRQFLRRNRDKYGNLFTTGGQI